MPRNLDAEKLLEFFAMEIRARYFAIKMCPLAHLLLLAFLVMACSTLRAQSSSHAPTVAEKVPEWAQPGSPTHHQVAPPADFHRASRIFDAPIGIFQGQADIGAAVVPGSATYDAKTQQYTIASAGYNIWYMRDEFRYLWSKRSGDVLLAANVSFPDEKGYGDRKAVLVIRQTLDDDAKEAMAGEHGVGMIHLAERAVEGASMSDMQFRFGGTLNDVKAKRIGIEKRGDLITLLVSLSGEPMHPLGPPIQLHFDGPFYVGIGFCSHLPDKLDRAVLSDVVLEGVATKGNAREKQVTSR